MSEASNTPESSVTDPPPASGAWFENMPAAEREFFELSPDRPYVLESGGELVAPQIAYETWGNLDATSGNAVLVCHALTGDAHAYGEAGPGQQTPGWWNDFIGPGRPIDTDRFFVVCANVLGVWIRNPLRVVYLEDGIRPGGGERVLSDRFAFAHGCLDGHLLAGEEAFVLERRAEDDSVWYGVCAFSKPAHPLAAAGYPAVRFLQWKFGRDSCAAVKQGVARARGEEAREAKR